MQTFSSKNGVAAVLSINPSGTAKVVDVDVSINPSGTAKVVDVDVSSHNCDACAKARTIYDADRL